MVCVSGGAEGRLAVETGFCRSKKQLENAHAKRPTIHCTSQTAAKRRALRGIVSHRSYFSDNQALLLAAYNGE